MGILTAMDTTVTDTIAISIMVIDITAMDIVMVMAVIMVVDTTDCLGGTANFPMHLHLY